MASHAAKTLRPEDEVSHYRIVGPLGAGGMGEVYLAQDQSLERNVALKILPPDLVKSEERLRRFVLEAKSASSLSHPNIVTIYEIGSDPVRSRGEPDSEPVHFISMELVSGKTLSALIHEDRADLRTLLGYLAQAADGLAKAHAAGIVHRDLKPGNIMVTADGFAKVLDFGLAKLTESRGAEPDASSAPTVRLDATGEGIMVGTAGYMSPEQVQGKSVDARSDIFSFGCILYEAATRRRPFLADNTIETLHKILNENPVSVEDLNPEAPSDLRRLIRRCLAKNPDQRLQSMKDLSLELRDIVDDFDALSASASSGSRTVGPAVAPARRAFGTPALVIAAAVVVAGLGVGWWGLQRARHASRAQPFETMNMTTVTNRGDVVDCALSADGRYLAYIAEKAGRLSLRVRQVATGSDVEVLPPSSAAIESPSFSPDGNYLFYLVRRPDAQFYRALYRVPSLGGTARQVAFDIDSRVSFSPDGSRIVFARGVLEKKLVEIVELDLGSGKERVVGGVPQPEFMPGSPVLSPDGRMIAAGLFDPSGRPRSVVALFDVATGRRRDHVTLDATQIGDIAWLPDGSGIVANVVSMQRAGINSQLVLIGYPGSEVRRITNDFSSYKAASVSAGDEALATVRRTRIENLWIADLSGGAPRQITAVSNSENSPAGITCADSGTVVYQAPGDQSVQLWALAASGGAPRALTAGPLLSFGAQGASGRIAFDRADPSGMHVWSVRADGSELKQLTTGVGEQVRGLSPDGRYVVFQRFDSAQAVWLVSAAGGTARRFRPYAAGIVGFSPDGGRLLLVRDVQGPSGLVRVMLSAYRIPDGAATDSLLLPGQGISTMWSPDGRGVLYRDASDPARNIHRQDFRGGPPSVVTRFPEGRITGFAPSPDGRRLAIVRRIGEADNVWLTEPDGARPIQVTRFGAGQVFQVCWFPDGRRLAISAGTLSSDAVLVKRFR